LEDEGIEMNTQQLARKILQALAERAQAGPRDYKKELKQSLKENLTLLRSAHLLAHGALRARGYQWELRRSGELKLGLWKKTLKAKDRKKSFPKRLVVVPGFGDTPLSWLMVLGVLRPVISRQFDEVVLVDFPGFSGFLSREKSFHSMDLLVNSLHDVFDTLKPHTILGHSLGGWLTSAYACACGMEVRPAGNRKQYTGPEAVILVDPAGMFASDANKEEWTKAFKSTATEGFKNLRPHVFGKEPPWFKLFLDQFNQFVMREEIQQFIESVREDHFVEKNLQYVKCKVWILWGENDSLVPSECARKWIDAINANRETPAEAQGVVIKGVGHSPQVETPGATAAVIGQILTGRTPHRIGSRFWRVV